MMTRAIEAPQCGGLMPPVQPCALLRLWLLIAALFRSWPKCELPIGAEIVCCLECALVAGQDQAAVLTVGQAC
jgi:hypothetical protein